MHHGDWMALAMMLAVVLVAAACLVAQALATRRRLDVIRAAIEADQPDVAQALLTTRWSHVALHGAKTAAVGLVLTVAGTTRPELAGLTLVGSVLLAAAVPVAVYAVIRERYPSGAGAGCLALGVVAFAVGALAIGGWLLASRPGGPWASTAGATQWLPGPTSQDQQFSQHLQQLTGAAVGTAHPVIGGQRAEPVLTGASYGMQSCGSPFHSRLRFATPRPGYLNIYYLPDTEEYLVIGEARVEPADVVVRDGCISAGEALRPRRTGHGQP